MRHAAPADVRVIDFPCPEAAKAVVVAEDEFPVFSCYESGHPVGPLI